VLSTEKNWKLNQANRLRPPLIPNLSFGLGLIKVLRNSIGSRNLRTLYLPICLFGVLESIPKFYIRKLFGIFPRLSAVSGHKFWLKMTLSVLFFFNTVLPRYSWFQNFCYFDRMYLPRITRAACTLHQNDILNSAMKQFTYVTW